MKNSLRLLGVLLILVLGAAPNAAAQTMAAGTWSGKAVDPDGGEFDLSFEVETTDSLRISIVAPDGEKYPVTEVRFDQGKLLFRWDAGVTINCTLAPSEGGSYSGPCIDDQGGAGTITMFPPRQE